MDKILIVTEPTISGLHDLKWVLEIARHFGIDASVCISKYDINPSKIEEIEEFCDEWGVPVLGRLPYDDVVTEVIIEEETIVEHSDSELSDKVREI